MTFRRRHVRWATGLIPALVFSTTLASARPAVAIARDTISDPQDTPNGLDIQSATRVANVAAGTETLTIQDYSPFTDDQTFFRVFIDTDGDGAADEWVLVIFDSTTGAVFAGVGQAGSFHMSPVAESRPTTSSIALTVPLAAVQGSTTFDWAVQSVAVSPTAGGAPVVDSAPDQPTVKIIVPVRVSGTDRIDTAVQSSFFPDGGADAVVLARSDAYPDALGGGPLAVAKNAPLLLTSPTALDPRTLAEIKRVLPSGDTVYLLGGLTALSQAVEDAVKAAGYATVRFAGTDRYDTSLQIVQQGLADPATIFLTTGADFPDALTAGAAAAHKSGGILLTNGNQMPAAVTTYLQAHIADALYAIGGPAAAADPAATPIVGTDRYDTGAKVAQTFFNPPTFFAVASGTNYPDALAGGATIAERDGPLLLTDANTLSVATQSFLTANKATLSPDINFVFGGTLAVSESVRAAISLAVYG